MTNRKDLVEDCKKGVENLSIQTIVGLFPDIIDHLNREGLLQLQREIDKALGVSIRKTIDRYSKYEEFEHFTKKDRIIIEKMRSERKSLYDLCEESGVNYNTFIYRVNKLHWSLEDALSPEPRRGKGRPKGSVKKG
ncbi:hypothetical protein M2277_005035 [Paenibacillus sp. LBL]|uniref:hypothetical protein n=1 Tax=Paenibacillus sp. LBL TaxID=2940563 RepID=UPI002476B1BB|nr:hypothetical protein [Paenibacillus sp. LBL]MDH6674343.1 hypothetical protein [Paenibacillus sp. LBL]